MKCLKQPILYTLSHHPRCFQQCSNPEKSEFLLEVTVGLIWLPVDDVTSLSPLLLLVLLGKNRKHQMISESEEGNLWASWLASPLFASVPIAHLLTFFIHNYGCLWIKKTIIKIHSYFGTSLNSVVSFEWPLVAVRVSLSKKQKQKNTSMFTFSVTEFCGYPWGPNEYVECSPKHLQICSLNIQNHALFVFMFCKLTIVVFFFTYICFTFLLTTAINCQSTQKLQAGGAMCTALFAYFPHEYYHNNIAPQHFKWSKTPQSVG